MASMHLVRATLLPALLACALAVPSAHASAFFPGEETVLQVRYLNLPTGESRIVVGEPSGDVWPVIFQAKTNGIAGFIDVREHLVSYWDSGARTSRGSDLRAYEVGDYHQDSARFDRANRQATVTVQRKGRVTRKTFAIPEDVHDLTSALMWLRLQPLAPGQRYEIPVVASSRHFTLVAQVVDRERVKTPAGTFAALRLQIRTQLEGKFSTKRDTFLWVSDDPRHILVKAEADFAIGSIVATLKSYRPGAQVAAR
jgi:hypothetical protein